MNREDETGIFLMGDFNSSPESPVMKYVLEGHLESHYKPLPSCLGISSSNVHSGETSKVIKPKMSTLLWE